MLPSELELHRHVVIGPDPAHLGPSRSERRPTDETHPTNVRTQIERVHVEVLQGWQISDIGGLRPAADDLGLLERLVGHLCDWTRRCHLLHGKSSKTMKLPNHSSL